MRRHGLDAARWRYKMAAAVAAASSAQPSLAAQGAGGKCREFTREKPEPAVQWPRPAILSVDTKHQTAVQCSAPVLLVTELQQ